MEAIPEFLKQVSDTAVLMIGVYLILDGKFTISIPIVNFPSSIK